MKSDMYYADAGCIRCSRLEREIKELKEQCATLEADNIRIYNNLAEYRNYFKKETAKEILQIIKDEYDYIGDLEKIIAKKYGVEE